MYIAAAGEAATTAVGAAAAHPQPECQHLSRSCRANAEPPIGLRRRAPAHSPQCDLARALAERRRTDAARRARTPRDSPEPLRSRIAPPTGIAFSSVFGARHRPGASRPGSVLPQPSAPIRRRLIRWSVDRSSRSSTSRRNLGPAKAPACAARAATDSFEPVDPGRSGRLPGASKQFDHRGPRTPPRKCLDHRPRQRDDRSRLIVMNFRV